MKLKSERISASTHVRTSKPFSIAIAEGAMKSRLIRIENGHAICLGAQKDSFKISDKRKRTQNICKIS